MNRLPNDIIERVERVEKAIADDRGGVLLLGLFLREDASSVWDLVVSTTWANPDSLDDLRYIAAKIHEAFAGTPLTFLSHIEVIRPDHPGLADVARLVEYGRVHPGGIVELRDETLFGLGIERAYLIAWPELDAMEATVSR